MLQTYTTMRRLQHVYATILWTLMSTGCNAAALMARVQLQGDPFGPFFTAAAQKVGAAKKHDGFDSSVIQVLLFVNACSLSALHKASCNIFACCPWRGRY